MQPHEDGAAAWRCRGGTSVRFAGPTFRIAIAAHPLSNRPRVAPACVFMCRARRLRSKICLAADRLNILPSGDHLRWLGAGTLDPVGEVGIERAPVAVLRHHAGAEGTLYFDMV